MVKNTKKISPLARKFISSLLTRNYKKRPTVEQALQHEWIVQMVHNPQPSHCENFTIVDGEMYAHWHSKHQQILHQREIYLRETRNLQRNLQKFTIHIHTHTHTQTKTNILSFFCLFLLCFQKFFFCATNQAFFLRNFAKQCDQIRKKTYTEIQWEQRQTTKNKNIKKKIK